MCFFSLSYHHTSPSLVLYLTLSVTHQTQHHRLVSAVSEVVRRGAIPFILGGSSELCAGVAAGLMSAVGGIMGVVNINSQLDVRDHLVRTIKHGCSTYPYRTYPFTK